MTRSLYETKVLLPLLALLLVSATARQSAAQFNVNVNLGPPPIAVREPPTVVLVPGSQVYFVPDVDYDVFFYNGYWWSSRGDRWYRARSYDGPWRMIPGRIVPPAVYRVPHDYRRAYAHERHIPYGQWKKGRDHGGEWKEHKGGPPWERGEGNGHGNGRGRHARD